MPVFFKAIFIAGLLALSAQIIRSLIPAFRRYHIPISFLGGMLAITLGDQVFGNFFDFSIIDAEVAKAWSEMTLPLVNIVFACIFLGRALPGLKRGLSLAAPQAAFGQTLAWGQYFVGGLATLMILKPYFGATDQFASLIEISFQGGVGVAIGMGPTFDSLGSADATPVAIALAPTAMLIGIVSGIVMLNVFSQSPDDAKTSGHSEPAKRKQNGQSASGERSTGFTESLLIQFSIVGLTIGLGMAFLAALDFMESNLLLGRLYQTSMVQHIPVFPMALLAGLAIQAMLDKVKVSVVNPRIMRKIEIFALEAVIIIAIGNLDIQSIGKNMDIFLILLISGTIWNIMVFSFLAPRILPEFWLQRGIADYGQSMGTTSIGLMLQSITDPKDRSSGREAFGIKQVFFEPFVGGGIITALSPLIIHWMGLLTFTICSAILCLSFALTGLIIKKKYSS